ncbi:hypothetical protein ACRQ5Q_14840 [Bradyrhizobium sp. PMVTL-01]|uniref:hypothetical protein n=1 Tax=Bradyrhizobium sp. PMVTL-01 TaxID=3434999 RepID=UPI003F6EF26B
MSKTVICAHCGYPRFGAVCERPAGFELQGCIQTGYRSQTQGIAKGLAIVLGVTIVAAVLVLATIAFADILP